MKVCALVNRWLEKKAHLTPRALEDLYRMARRWRAAVGAKEVSELGPEDVEAVERASAAGRSASYVNKERMYFRGWLRYAAELGLVSESVGRVWKRRQEVVKKEYVCLSREEEERLLAHCPCWLASIVEFAVATGLREGTLKLLTWGMVGEEGTLRVPPEIMKARKAHRIPLSGKAYAALGPRRGPTEALFPDLPEARVVYRCFKKAVKAACINPNTNVHDLRRTFVGRLLQAGCPTATVAQLGGWAGESVMIRHYLAEMESVEALTYLEKV